MLHVYTYVHTPNFPEGAIFFLFLSYDNKSLPSATDQIKITLYYD